jgi:glutathione S-transferase
MSLLTLYNYDLDDRCYTVRLMASFAAAPLTLRSVDVFPGNEHRSDLFRAINPLGRVPVLEDGDLRLSHLPAILPHVARAGPRGALFLPDDHVTAARMVDWLAFSADDWSVIGSARAASIFDAPGDSSDLHRASVAALRVLEDHLVSQSLLGADFAVGPDPTVADVALFPGFALSRDIGIDHDAYPALRAWARRVRALEGFMTMPGIPEYN